MSKIKYSLKATQIHVHYIEISKNWKSGSIDIWTSKKIIPIYIAITCAEDSQVTNKEKLINLKFYSNRFIESKNNGIYADNHCFRIQTDNRK